MDNNWQSFDAERECKILDSGKILSVRPKDFNISPLFCPLCEFPMKTSDDLLSFKSHNCCYKCEIYSAKSNWNPDKFSKEWEEYILFRKQTFRPTIQFK